MNLIRLEFSFCTIFEWYSFQAYKTADSEIVNEWEREREREKKNAENTIESDMIELDVFVINAWLNLFIA